MPITEKFLETQEVVVLTRHFLSTEAGKANSSFVEYQSYSQFPGTLESFGSPSVTTSVIAGAKKRLAQEGRSVPVLFACNGEPLDKDRKEEKESWTLSNIIFPIIQEWINRMSARPKENAESKENEAESQSEEQSLRNLDFDLHLALCKGHHWTLYVFRFREINRAILQQFLGLLLLGKEQLRDKARNQVGKVDGAVYSHLEQEQNSTIKKLLGQLYEQLSIFNIDSKHWAVPQKIQLDLRDFFQNPALAISQSNCSYQQDDFTCGDRTARHAVYMAGAEGLNCNLSTQQWRQETMVILNYSVQNNKIIKKDENLENFYIEDYEDAGPSEETLENVLYVILAFIVSIVICLVINHFVTASALTVIGGFWGMFGIAMGGLLVLKFATGVLGVQIDRARENQNKDINMPVLSKQAVKTGQLKPKKPEIPRKTPCPPPYPKPVPSESLVRFGSTNTPQ